MGQPFRDDDDAFAALGAAPRPGQGRGAVTLVRPCLDCKSYSDAGAVTCESCGGPLGTVEAAASVAPGRKRAAASTRSYARVDSNCTRTMYIVLALLLGGLGVHNFYAHRWSRAVGQLAMYASGMVLAVGASAASNGPLVVLSVGISIALFVWVVVDIVSVTEDGDGFTLR